MKLILLIFAVISFSLTTYTQLSTDSFFAEVDTFMFHYVSKGKVNYKSIKTNLKELNELNSFIEKQPFENFDKNTKKAYLINVYNLLVIKQVLYKYPIKSPMDVAGFFETSKFNIGGKKYTLNEVENNLLRKQYNDPRLHFVLVCGALGCPVIANFAYTPLGLEDQLKKQTKKAMNNSKFLYENESGVYLSEIFKWYKEDFGGTSESALTYINKYRTKPFSKTSKIQFYTYDWKLNEFIGNRNEYPTQVVDKKTDNTLHTLDTLDLKIKESSNENVIMDSLANQGKLSTTEFIQPINDTLSIQLKEEKIDSLEQTTINLNKEEEINLQTYTAGTLLKKGQFDFTLFNTIYTETKGNWLGNDFSGNRTSLFTSSFHLLFGVSKNKRVNIGLELNYKTTSNSNAASFNKISDVFTFQNNATRRSGLANVGLRAKLSPFKGVNDFSIQSTFYIPTIKSPEGYFNPDGSGNGNLTWSDWNRYVSWTQFFYVKSYRKFQVFTEVDVLYRRKVLKTQMDHLDLPATFILSYFPTRKLTFYGIGQHATRFLYNIKPTEVNDWVQPMNYSALGIGFKYQPKSNITLELLYTNFVRGVNTGLGSTFNVGIKLLTR